MKTVLIICSVLIWEIKSNPLAYQEPPHFIDQFRWTATRDGEGQMQLVDLNPIIAEPEPVFNPIEDVFYLLFTRSNPTEGQRLSFDLNSIRNSNFRRHAGVRFLIHGWGGSTASPENSFTRDELLRFADQNVIIVDWSAGAGTSSYITARNRVGPAGNATAQFIDFLQANNYLHHSQITIIGYSLGSHVAGHVGKNVRNGRISAIFGTDPAGPLFSLGNPGGRLDSEDAIYTEAIHTNSGGLGFSEPITHASFYPNWGSSQPSCDNDDGCSHGRSTRLYSESINSNAFRSRQCTSHNEIIARNCPGTGVFAIMGGDSAKSIRGVFFLETNAAAPFALG